LVGFDSQRRHFRKDVEMVIILGAIVIIGVGFAAFGFGGTLFDKDLQNPDYLWRLGVGRSTLLVIGVVALIAAVVAAVALWSGGRLTRRGTVFVTRLAVLAALTCLGLAVLTAPVIGANIGGGIFLILGLPILAVLAILSVVAYLRAA